MLINDDDNNQRYLNSLNWEKMVMVYANHLKITRKKNQ